LLPHTKHAGLHLENHADPLVRGQARHVVPAEAVLVFGPADADGLVHPETAEYGYMAVATLPDCTRR
jgi:hypothetical protein